MTEVKRNHWSVILRIAVVLAAVLLLAAVHAQAAYADTIDLTGQIASGDDITETFISAAKRARGADSHTTIIVPPGTYYVGQLKVWGNTTVQMEGVTFIRKSTSTSSMLRLGNLSTDFKAANNGAGVTGYSPDFSDIHFIGGTWDGAGLKKCIMQIGHAANMSYENVVFKDVKESHHLEFGAVNGLKITGCTFQGFQGNFASSYNGEAIQLEILSPNGSHFSGYNSNTDETICQNIEISNCTFKNLKRGVGSHTGLTNSYFDNIQIHDNTFEDVTGYAISMMNYQNSSAYNNTITNCGAGILCCTYDKSNTNFYPAAKTPTTRSTPATLGNTIHHNTITITKGANGAAYNNVNYGIRLYGVKKSATGDWRVSGVKVTNNTITLKVTGYAIWLEGGYKNTLQSNKITCNVTTKGKGGNGDGIRLQYSSSNTIKSNTITNKKTTGYAKNMCGIVIRDASSSNTVASNTITKSSKYGIQIIGSSNSNKIQNNTIKTSGTDGVHIESSKKITVTGNKFQSFGRYGICSSKTLLKKVSGNKFTGKIGKRAYSYK